jgi:hypothetical protein
MPQFNIPIDERVCTVVKYLMDGGEMKVEGQTFVWLHNHVTGTVNGEEVGIDGLALKGEQFETHQDFLEGINGKPHYLGQQAMPLNYFIDLISKLPDTEISRMARDN